MWLNELTYSGEENIIPEITLTEKEMVLEVKNYLAEQWIVDVKVLSAEQVKDEKNSNSIQIRFQYINTNDENWEIVVDTLILKNILDIKVSKEKAERRANRPTWLNDYLDSQKQELQELFDSKWRKYQEWAIRDQKLLADKYSIDIDMRISQEKADDLGIPPESLDRINQVLLWNNNIKLTVKEEKLLNRALNTIIKLRDKQLAEKLIEIIKWDWDTDKRDKQLAEKLPNLDNPIIK